jgi:hypothetical protein
MIISPSGLKGLKPEPPFFMLSRLYQSGSESGSKNQKTKADTDADREFSDR